MTSDPVDSPSSLEELTTYVDAKFNELDSKLNGIANEIYKNVNRQTESQEQVIAQLLMAYQELTVVMEVTLHKLWGSDIEQTEDFKKKLNKERSRMLDWIRSGAASASLSEQDLIDALGGVFPQDSGNDN